MEKRPLILITNDDGYSSKGIVELVRMAQRIGDVVVVAPDSPQSGKSHAITFGTFLRLKPVDNELQIKMFSVTGTPVDCVKMAINKILDRQPDLLISGINHGSNATVNAFYSGTMGAAMEGAMNDIPSIGLSLCSYDADADFSVTIKYSESLIMNALQRNTNPNLCLNVNFPNVPESEFKGLKVCRQSKGLWKEKFLAGTDPFGQPYYWLSGDFINNEPQSADTDEWALQNGYASVVPMNLDSTDFRLLDQTQNLL